MNRQMHNPPHPGEILSEALGDAEMTSPMPSEPMAASGMSC